MDAKPSLSVGAMQCETVEQVWVVSRQDRHKLSQARPIGTHLKSFSPYLCTHRHKKAQSLSHIDTESCQSTDSVFLAIKLMVLSLAPIWWCLNLLLCACVVFFNKWDLIHCLGISLLVAWQLAVTLHSFRAVLEINPHDNVFFLSALTSSQHIYNAEPTLQFKGLNFWEASAALALTLLFLILHNPSPHFDSEIINHCAPKNPANFPIY